VSNATKWLNANLGFPLACNRTNSLSVDELSRMVQSMDSLGADASSFSGVLTLASSNRRWEQYTNRVQRLRSLSANLLDPTGQSITATLYLGGQSRHRDEKDKWRDKWRQISLGSADPKRTDDAEDKALGDLSIDATMQLVLFTGDSSTRVNFPPEDLGDWGVLQCLNKYEPRREKKGDNTTWIVDIPVDPEKGGGLLPLKVKFSQPLNLDPWPK
jgi:hypothetical protein